MMQRVIFDAPVYCMAHGSTHSKTGKRKEIYAVGVGTNVYVMHLKNFEYEKKLATLKFESTVYSVSLDSRRQQLATGLANGVIIITSLLNNTFKKILQSHFLFINQLYFTPCGTRLISQSHDTSIKLWDIDRETCIQSRTCGYSMSNFAYINDNATILMLLGDGRLCRFGTDWNETTESFKIDLAATCFSWVNASIIVGSSKGTLTLYKSNKVQWSSSPHRLQIMSINPSSCSQYLATCSEDVSVAVICAAFGLVLRKFEGHLRIITGAFFTQDTQNILTCSYDQTVQKWHLFPDARLKIFALISIFTKTINSDFEIFSNVGKSLQRLLYKF